MCWSPTADLLAGGAVMAIGVLTVTGVRRARDLPLAALPLILGAHQLVESVVWRSTDGDVSRGVGDAATLLWAMIAYPLLPAFVPLAVLAASGHRARMRLLPLVIIGLLTSALTAYALATGPVVAEPVGHTMRYGVYVPLGNLAVVGYLIATIGSLLASDQRKIQRLGVVVGVGAAVCATLWQQAFVSTWCALAAVTSLILLDWVRRPRSAVLV